IELRFFSPCEKYLNHGFELQWATCPAKLEVADGAMNPVARVLHILFECRKRLTGERCVSQLDVQGPTRIIQRANGHAVTVLPIAVAVRKIPVLESLERVWLRNR